MTATNAQDDRRTHPTPGAGRVYGVGCLPLLLVWFLVDLIGKVIIWGIASLFGVQMPALATTIKWTAYAIFIPLGAIFIATLIWMLYQRVLDLARNIFRKDKKDKDRPTETSS